MINNFTTQRANKAEKMDRKIYLDIQSAALHCCCKLSLSAENILRLISTLSAQNSKCRSCPFLQWASARDFSACSHYLCVFKLNLLPRETRNNIFNLSRQICACMCTHLHNKTAEVSNWWKGKWSQTSVANIRLREKKNALGNAFMNRL